MKSRVLPALPLLLVSLALLLAVPASMAKLSVSATRSLSFGRFIAGTSIGSVTVNPAGIRTSSGVFPLQGGTVSSAALTITESGVGNPKGNPAPAWFISLPAPGAASLASSGKPGMPLSFTSTPANGSIQTGTVLLTVGASLTVAGNQPAGDYSGTFSVTVNYN